MHMHRALYYTSDFKNVTLTNNETWKYSLIICHTNPEAQSVINNKTPLAFLICKKHTTTHTQACMIFLDALFAVGTPHNPF